MRREPIGFDEFNVNAVRVWANDWFLLTAGENAPGKYNTMTVAWGSIGCMWGKPFAQIVVRPSRHTYQFTEACDDFTLSGFGDGQRDALNLCGTKSGRDVDKVAAAGLTAIPSTQIASPAFDEAELILECRKIYRDKFSPDKFLSDDIETNYNGSDYHVIYFGEIVAIHGAKKYRSS